MVDDVDDSGGWMDSVLVCDVDDSGGWWVMINSGVGRLAVNTRLTQG